MLLQLSIRVDIYSMADWINSATTSYKGSHIWTYLFLILKGTSLKILHYETLNNPVWNNTKFGIRQYLL